MGERERDDDATIRDILSQLSKDRTVLDEVREIALRGLKAQVASSGSGNNQNSPEAGRVNNGKTSSSEQAINRNKPVVQSPRQEKVEQHTATAESVEVKVDKDSDTFQNIMSTVKRYRDSFLNKPMVLSPRQEKAEQNTTTAESDEDLAFKVDKDSDTYRNIMSTAKWYRDSFLIGSTHADQQSAGKKDDEVQSSGANVHISGDQRTNQLQNIIPKSDPTTATGHPLLLSAAENYVRSIAAVDLLRPYATWVVSSDGPMFQTATQSLAQTIPLGQSSCDWAMRENLLWVLKDEEWREFAKNITTTYVDRSYKDG